MKPNSPFPASLLVCLAACCSVATADSLDDIFKNPPPEARPHVMWMWMGSNVTRQGITKDLEAFHDAGYGGTMMMSLADSTTPWPCDIGKSPTPEVIAFTKPWWDLVRHTSKESARLGLDFGMASSPGYSTSGGPWITPELSMLDVCFSETPTKGPGEIRLDLPKPEIDPRGEMHFPVFNPETGKIESPVIPARKTFFRDIAVLALPAKGVVARDQVFDLTGKSSWKAPAGEWTIYRFGYTTKGILLQPPQWQANGLECDKLNPEAVSLHIDHVIGEVQKNVGDLIGKGFNFIHVDSYEAGVPEWTPRMREEFSARRGYDMTPFLATLAKRTIVNDAETKRFQADFKDTIRDLFRDVYYKILHEKLTKAGLVFSSEPYGGEWRADEIVPQVDRLLVEFWTLKDNFRVPTIKAGQKAGQNLIEAEAFTGSAVVSRWSEFPAWLKPIGDAGFCAGINRLVLHRVVPQPWDERYKPGNSMGWWGTHFDHTQTWWDHGKAMVKYWQRCQALLQWGKFTTSPMDFSARKLNGDVKISAIHRTGDGADVWFVANRNYQAGTVKCLFQVTGKQPELWDPVTGETRDLTDFEQRENATSVPLDFASGQSFFIVFREPAQTLEPKANTPALTTVSEIDGPWQVRFDPKWGGPDKPVTFDKLVDWTQRPEPGIRFYSGTAVYRKSFDTAPENLWLDLGTVNHTARVRLNGREIGVVWTAPWGVDLPADLLKSKDNQLEIEVANVWANRLIGDEHEPPDCEWNPGPRGEGGWLKEFPDWFLKNQPRPSKGRYTFTTWNYFTKKSPLVPSGLTGPVKLMRRDWTRRETPEGDTGGRSLSPKNAEISVTGWTDADSEAAFEADLPHVRLTVSASDNTRHVSGGSGPEAVINGTTRNGDGDARTLNDGKTYRGYANGNTLTLQLDLTKSPAGYDIATIHSIAGHSDARAGQHYQISISSVDTPEDFKPITGVELAATKGSSAVAIRHAKDKPLATRAAALRFEFKDGPTGFLVYREFAVTGSPSR